MHYNHFFINIVHETTAMRMTIKIFEIHHRDGQTERRPALHCRRFTPVVGFLFSPKEAKQ